MNPRTKVDTERQKTTPSNKHLLLTLFNKRGDLITKATSRLCPGRLRKGWILLRYKFNMAIRYDIKKKSGYRKSMYLMLKSLLREDNASEFHNLKPLNQLKSAIRREIGFPVINNANGTDESNYNKRALLIYLVKAFLFKTDDAGFLKHQNLKRCIHIASILGEFGYIVDVADTGDLDFKPSKSHSLVINVRHNLRETDTIVENNSINIYLATSLYHKLHNSNIRRRHDLLFERRGRRVHLRRIYPEEMPYVERSDAIICIGNEFIMNTWREAFKVPTYTFNNCGFKDTEIVFDSKDFSSAKMNFLFFASRSQIQKSLDLLLEIFPSHPDLHLYICSEFAKEEDFCVCYHKEIYETSNIHPIGWVTVNSPKYNELVQKCAFVIHPTCSEGQPGSVVQCMHSGLIPLVTREAGIDTEDFGITFADDSLEEIERVIIEVSELPGSWHMERSVRTRKVSEEKYSENAFMDRWRDILAEILNCAGK